MIMRWVGMMTNLSGAFSRRSVLRYSKDFDAEPIQMPLDHAGQSYLCSNVLHEMPSTPIFCCHSLGLLLPLLLLLLLLLLRLLMRLVLLVDDRLRGLRRGYGSRRVVSFRTDPRRYRLH